MIDSEPIVTLSYKVMMTSSKCLDLDCSELFSCILFRRKYYFKKLKSIFHKFDSEPIVTLGYKSMMTSSKCLDLDCFKLFSCVLFRINIVPRDWKTFLTDFTIPLGYKIMMTSSKWLDFNYFELLFSYTLFRSNNFWKRLK